MKKISIIVFIVMILLSGCTTKDKNIVLSEDTSGDINSKYEVKVETMSDILKEEEVAIPLFYEKDSMYVAIGANKDTGEYIESELVKLDINLSEREKIRNLDSSSEVSIFASRYYIGTQSNTGGIKVIKDSLLDEEYEIYERDFLVEESNYYGKDETFISEQKMNILENNESYYVSSSIGYGGILDENGVGYQRQEKNIRISQIDLCDFINNKKFSYIETAYTNNSSEGIITKIDYSKNLNKFYAFNQLGEIFELELKDEIIIPKLIYKVPLKEDEFIEYTSNVTTSSIISKNKILYNVYSIGEGKDKYGVVGASKNYKFSKVLDLSNLSEYDTGVKLSSTNMNFIKTKSGLVLINTSLGKVNEYMVLDLLDEKSEVVYKFTIKENQLITTAISNENGSKLAIGIVDYNRIEDMSNEGIWCMKFSDSQVLELNINKLF